jgi:hypothetical protein
MLSICPIRTGAILASIVALNTLSLPAMAGNRPQVDLSVSVSTTPERFVADGIATVTMVVHNAGPDTAGGVLPNEPYIIVYEKPYDIVTRPPPFILPEPSTGCTAYVEESEYIPGLPGGGITLMFSYWFDVIPSGQSRTCTYRVQFLPSTLESFETRWIVRTSNDDDVNESNNRFDYTFVAASLHAAVSVPALSLYSLVLLGFSLLLTVGWMRQHVSTGHRSIDGQWSHHSEGAPRPER